MKMIAAIWRALMTAGSVRMWGLLLAGPVVTALTIYFAEIVRQPVPEALQHTQLEFLGWALLSALALLGVIVTALAAARVSLKGPAGTEFTADSTHEATDVRSP